jgi:hypothetical protein
MTKRQALAGLRQKGAALWSWKGFAPTIQMWSLTNVSPELVIYALVRHALFLRLS